MSRRSRRLTPAPPPQGSRRPTRIEAKATDGPWTCLPISNNAARGNLPSLFRHVRASMGQIDQWPQRIVSVRRRGGMADAPALGAGARKGVEVQILSPTPGRGKFSIATGSMQYDTSKQKILERMS